MKDVSLLVVRFIGCILPGGWVAAQEEIGFSPVIHDRLLMDPSRANRAKAFGSRKITDELAMLSHMLVVCFFCL